MTMKEYSTHPRFPELEPHYQIQFSVIPSTPLFGAPYSEVVRKPWLKPMAIL